MTIASTLEDLTVTLGARSVEYGSPDRFLSRLAGLWSVVLDADISPRRAALMLACLKVARLAENDGHGDSWADLAGYAVLGAVVGADAVEVDDGL